MSEVVERLLDEKRRMELEIQDLREILGRKQALLNIYGVLMQHVQAAATELKSAKACTYPTVEAELNQLKIARLESAERRRLNEMQIASEQHEFHHEIAEDGLEGSPAATNWNRAYNKARQQLEVIRNELTQLREA